MKGNFALFESTIGIFELKDVEQIVQEKYRSQHFSWNGVSNLELSLDPQFFGKKNSGTPDAETSFPTKCPSVKSQTNSVFASYTLYYTGR